MLNIPYVYRHARFSAEELILKVKKLRDQAALALRQNDDDFDWRAGDKEIQRLLDWPDRGAEAEGHFSFNEYLSRIEGDLERGSSGVFQCAGRSSQTAFHLIRKLAGETYLAFGFFHSQAKSMTALKRNRRKFSGFFDNIDPISYDDLDAIIAQTKLDARNAARSCIPRLPVDAGKDNPTPYLSGSELDFVFQLLCTGRNVQLSEGERKWLQDYLESTTPDDCIDGSQAFERLQAVLAMNGGRIAERCMFDTLITQPRMVARIGAKYKIANFGRKLQVWELFSYLLRAGAIGRQKKVLIKDIGFAGKSDSYVRKLRTQANEIVMESLRVEIQTRDKDIWTIVDLDAAT